MEFNGKLPLTQEQARKAQGLGKYDRRRSFCGPCFSGKGSLLQKFYVP